MSDEVSMMERGVWVWVLRMSYCRAPRASDTLPPWRQLHWARAPPNWTAAGHVSLVPARVCL